MNYGGVALVALLITLGMASTAAAQMAGASSPTYGVRAPTETFGSAPPIEPPNYRVAPSAAAAPQGGAPGGGGTQQGGAPAGGGAQQGGAAAADEVYLDEATEERIRRQAGGDYGEVARTTGVPLGATQDAWGRPFENMASGQVSPGVVRFQWSPELIMPVRVRLYMTTLVTLPSFEKVQDVWIGEQTYFQVALVRDNAIGIRAGAAGLDTNLMIVGSSGNVYQLYLRAEGTNTQAITDMAVFIDAAPPSGDTWFTGDRTAVEPAVAGRGAKSPPAPSTEEQVPATLAGGNLQLPLKDLSYVHKLYEVKPGDRVIAPEWVGTDGRFTYLYYGDRAGMVERPVVSKVVDGIEGPVNTRTVGENGEVVVIEAVGEFVLRNGGRTVCVKLAENEPRRR